MTAVYRVAVIGRTGRGNYGHGLDVVWTEIEEAQIVAVADEDAAGRERAAARLKAPRAYADYREMLEKERPQIVSVAPRWTDSHRDMVVACAEYGCHIFLEKPMCQSLEEADEMVAACERAHVKLAMAHQTRYSPVLHVIRDLVGSGRLGRILELRGRGKEDHRGGGEDLLVLGTHIMDLMRLLAGDPSWCFAHVAEGGRPVTVEHVRAAGEDIGPIAGDEIHAVYRFSPAMGYFSTCRAPHGASERFGLTIYGSLGVIHVGTGSLPPAQLLEDPSWRPGHTGGAWVPITSAGVGRPEPLQDRGLHLGNLWIVRDLLEAIRRDTLPRGSMYDGRAALEMILAAYESHRLGTPVQLPLQNRRHPLRLLQV